MRARWSRILAVIAATAVLILPSTATATPAEVRVKLRPKAVSADGGDVVLVEVKVSCRPVGEVLAALVTVDDGRIFGEGFIAGVVCDGKQRRHVVDVQGFDGGFGPGPAQASAFVLLCDDAGDCVQGQDSRIIRITN
ncbi:MAG: hypothetical protein ACRDHO_04690 [Actinomycetota bacterium]